MTDHKQEAGFTLIEALAAMLVLSIGLMAVANLFLVSGTSNIRAHKSTGATVAATETMERLKAVPIANLIATPGGNLNADAGPLCLEPGGVDCVAAGGGFNVYRDIAGIGRSHTTWTVAVVGALGNVTFITVRSEILGPFGGPVSRAEFTTFRY